MRHGVGLLWLSILRHLPCACAGKREGEPSEWLRDEPLGRLLEARVRQREADGGHAGRVAAWGPRHIAAETLRRRPARVLASRREHVLQQ